jgi:hypothetical protein
MQPSVLPGLRLVKRSSQLRFPALTRLTERNPDAGHAQCFESATLTASLSLELLLLVIIFQYNISFSSFSVPRLRQAVKKDTNNKLNVTSLS